MTVNQNLKGILIPIGGKEDKGEKKNTLVNYFERGILSHIVRETGGPLSKIIVIPTASRIPDEIGKSYIKAFGKLGCTNVEVLPILRRNHSENKEIVQQVREADCIMFTGGNQSRIETIIHGTSVHQVLLERFKHEPIVIAGTSAGAMAMASEMIAGGSSVHAMQKGAVKMKNGLGLIPQLIIDTHFVRRGRFGRLAEAMARFPDKVGVGLAEDTGLIIRNNNEFQVIGSGMVIVMDPLQLIHNSYLKLKQGTPMSMSNLTTHILANGDRFRLDDRAINVLPMTESFV